MLYIYIYIRVDIREGGMSNMLFLCRLAETHPPIRNEPDKSRPLACREISLVAMSSKIAKRLAKVHQLEVPIWKEPDYICDALQR
uniref:Protein kinase domain-containing protein n=1 Tax=Heterorhabditis bacteriophora TaxID=37862 RepID=A0A1I7X8M8_HETBA